jgi:CDP-diacylglycerol--glycerol-3-phosphate 3-phosphatidyltransferase
MNRSGRGVVLINLLTGSRLLLAALVVLLTPWLGVTNEGTAAAAWALWLALGLVGMIEISDLADGQLARRHNVVTGFGKLFDPYADSVSRLMVYWALAVAGRCLAIVPLVMAVRDVSVTYVRIVLTRRGRDGSARLSGKLKALVQGTVAPILMAGPLVPGWGQIGAWVIATGSVAVIGVTVASLVDYGLAALREK